MTTEQRIEILERRIRTLTSGMVALAVAAGLVLWQVGRRNDFALIRASTIEVVGDSGQTLVKLGANEAGAGQVVVLNQDGSLGQSGPSR